MEGKGEAEGGAKLEASGGWGGGTGGPRAELTLSPSPRPLVPGVCLVEAGIHPYAVLPPSPAHSCTVTPGILTSGPLGPERVSACVCVPALQGPCCWGYNSYLRRWAGGASLTLTSWNLGGGGPGAPLSLA